MPLSIGPLIAQAAQLTRPANPAREMPSLSLLAVLWGPRLLRTVFEAGSLRFVGLISYSLYLWHEPVLDAVLPHLRMPSLGLQAAVDLAVGVFVAIPVAYQDSG